MYSFNYLKSLRKVSVRSTKDLDFFENKFSRYQCGFRKGFNTQNALLSMVEKMQLASDKKEVFGAILTVCQKL